MSKYFSLVFIVILGVSCKNHLYSQQSKDVYQQVVSAFIEDRNSQIKIDPKQNILILAANTNENDMNSYNIIISFVNPKLLTGFHYSKVYKIDEYRLIIDESKDLRNKSELLKKFFKETKYEDLNLAIKPIEYDSKYWLITFNSKNEITHISPSQKSKEIKLLLLNKEVKFSVDFED